MSHKQVLQVGIAVVLVMLFLVGCGGSAPTAVSEAPAATSAPEQVATPTPAPPTPTFTPAATTGHVKGVFIDPNTQQPFVAKQIFLPLAEEKADGTFSISLEIGKTLETKADNSGAFLFEDVPPGKYGLSVFTGFNVSTMRDEKGAFRVFEVAAGQVVDLGNIPVQ
jgi:hypothetical protein